MSNYLYSVFGLNIASEFECPEFQKGNGPHNVLIKLGSVPREIQEPKHKGVRFETNENEFLLNVDNVAQYYVTDNTITIQPDDNYDLDSIRVFLYGSAFAALLMQNNILPLHANVLEKNGKAFLIAGNSGAGKSTLSTVLYKKGYSIFSDDVTALKIENGKLQALPGIIYPKLWEQTLEQLGEDKTELKKIRPDMNKYRFTKIDNRFNEKHEIQKMFLISLGSNAELEAARIEAHKKLVVLIENTFRKTFVYGSNLKSQQFSHFSQIASKIDLWKITRPKELNTIDEIVKLIESKLEQ